MSHMHVISVAVQVRCRWTRHLQRCVQSVAFVRELLKEYGAPVSIHRTELGLSHAGKFLCDSVAQTFQREHFLFL